MPRGGAVERSMADQHGRQEEKGGKSGGEEVESRAGDQVDGGVNRLAEERRDGEGGNGSNTGGREGAEEEDRTWGPIPSLEDKFGGLHLRGEEEVDLDFNGELEDLVRDVRWLAIFRVHTTRQFSHSALFNAMRTA